MADKQMMVTWNDLFESSFFYCTSALIVSPKPVKLQTFSPQGHDVISETKAALLDGKKRKAERVEFE